MENCTTIFKKLTNPNIRNTVLVDMSSVLSMGQEDEDMHSDDNGNDETLSAPSTSPSRLKLSDPTRDALDLFLRGNLCQLLARCDSNQ